MKLSIIYFDIQTGFQPSLNHGLAYLIGSLKNDNHNVALYHLKNKDEINSLQLLLNKEFNDLICLSFTTNQKKYVKDFLSTDIKFNTKLIIAGGVHCTILKEAVLKEFPRIAGICIGEGELPLKKLCQRISCGEDHSTTPSFYFRSNNNIHKNSIAPLQKIDKSILPDYSLFNYKEIISSNGQCFPMMLSRGCPFNCSYCCNHIIKEVYPNKNEYVRFPAIQHSIEIIKKNLSLWPSTKKIVFADDNFTTNKNWLSEFCIAYKKEIDLPFMCNSRVETINEQTVKELKHAGCVSIDFGIESGNEWLRKYILNRHHSNQVIKDAFALTKKHGIKTFSYNMIGLPFETKKMVKDTYKLNTEIQPDWGKCFYFYPYPESKLYNLCQEYNLLPDNLDIKSGYLESPSLKNIFMSQKEQKKYFDLMQVYFCSRLVFSKLRVPRLIEWILQKIVFIFRIPIASILQPDSKAVRLRRLMRKFAMKYFRGNA